MAHAAMDEDQLIENLVDTLAEYEPSGSMTSPSGSIFL